jgi:peptidoglycan hydrolase-like protein with peptidoglycan-binding domain
MLAPTLAAVLAVPPAAAVTRPAGTASPVTSAVFVNTPAAMPTLRQGSRGPAVVTLQQKLTALRYDVGPIDGVFGDSTLHGVVAFQKVQGIGRDGIVGPTTWGKLTAPHRPAPRYRLPSTSLEVDLTRQVVYLTQQDSVLRILDASTGSGQRYYSGGWQVAVTPTGRFAISRRYNVWQNGPLGWMYKPNYFYRGYAVHGSTSVPPYPASHGCVRVTTQAMDRLWPSLRIGMPVAVYR